MNTKLPFELNPNSLNEWLQSLSRLNSVNSANQLNKVIAVLRNKKNDQDKVFQLLEQLIPTILFICNNIELSFHAEQISRYTDKSVKIEKLCIQLLRNISLAFCTQSNQDLLSVEDQLLAYYYAIQFIGLAQRQSSLFHHCPSATLWEKTSEIFQTTSNRNIIDQQVNHTITVFKQQSSILAVIKRNILFAILSPYNHTTNTIKELFTLSNQNAHLIKFAHPEAQFCWNLDNKSSPYLTTIHYDTTSSTVTIETNAFLQLLQSKEFTSKLNQQSLDLIISQLTGYKKEINSIIPSTFTAAYLFIGFKNISKYIEKTEKLKKIQHFSTPVDEQQVTSNMSLELMEHEKSYLNAKTTPTTSVNQNNLLKTATPVKLLKTIKNHYIIAESTDLRSITGEICLLCNNEGNYQLGIIKQIKTTNLSKTTHTLIEIIPGIVSINQITAPVIAEKTILLINKNNSPVEFITLPCKLSKGNKIILNSDQTFTINQLIDYSSSYMHFVESDTQQ